MLKAYKYRIYPSKDQQTALDGFFGSVRFIYNLGLETKIQAWQSQRKNYTCFELCKQATELKNDLPWLKEVPAQSLQHSLKSLDAAYKCFFKGGGLPKFKNKRSKQSISFPQCVSIDFKIGVIKVPKLKDIPCVFSRPFAGKIKTVTITKTSTGKYFASILIDNGEELPAKRRIVEATTVGVDLGIKDLAILSDGAVFANNHFFKVQRVKLRVAQRKLQRKFKKGKEQSVNYQKQRLIVAKLHEKITNQRTDYLHKISTQIINGYDTICIEDLNVKGMIKNRKLSLAISEMGWSQFTYMLKYKAQWYGKNVLEIGQFEPSSKTCSSCGEINKELKLHHREWTCRGCDSHHDRDHNAALNIKNSGLRTVALNANLGQ